MTKNRLAKAKRQKMARRKNNIRTRLIKKSDRFSFWQLFVFALIFAGVGSWLVWRSFAAPVAFSFSNSVSSSSIGRGDNLIEQQNTWPLPSDQSLWVIHPDGSYGDVGSWDINEGWAEGYAAGYFNAGDTTSWTGHMVSDFMSGGNTAWDTYKGRERIGAAIVAPVASGVSVNVCYAPQSKCFSTSTGRWNSSTKMYEYDVCSQAIYYPTDPAMQIIPGSQGGKGIVDTITITVTNNSGQKLRNVSAGLGVSSAARLGGDHGPGCVNLPDWQFSKEYPFKWSTSDNGGDTTPPSAPANLQITSTSAGSISLSWNASTDNVGVNNYKIYRKFTTAGKNNFKNSFSSVGTSTTTGFSDTNNITSSTTYYYYVTALDAGGNESTPSVTAVVKL